MNAAIPTEMTRPERIREVVRLARVHRDVLARLEAGKVLPGTEDPLDEFGVDALEFLEEIAERLVALILDPLTLAALAPCGGPFLDDAAVRV